MKGCSVEFSKGFTLSVKTSEAGDGGKEKGYDVWKVLARLKILKATKKLMDTTLGQFYAESVIIWVPQT